MNPSLTIPLQRSVNARLNLFREVFPEGAAIGDFAEFVRESIVEINAILDMDKSDAATPDRRRIIRYYQSQGWISAPTRKIGREVIYDSIHLAQMFLAYCLRELKFPKDEIKKVAEMSLDRCLQSFSNELALASSSPPLNGPGGGLSQACDHFHIQLLATKEARETGHVARAIEALATNHGKSRLKVEVHKEEIELASDRISKKARGDGSIRSLISDFREQHRIDPDTLVQIVTSREHDFGWFADWGPIQPRDGVLHLENYELHFGVSRVALAASYSLLLAFCGELEERGISPYELFHHGHPRGCLFDFCGRKEDVVLKLLAGDICKDCLEKLRPHFSKELLREVARFLDAIRARVRVLRQFVPDPEDDLQKLLRFIFVHALVAANRREQTKPLSLPADGDDLEEWVFSPGVGKTLGIARELKALKPLVRTRLANREVEGGEWTRSRDAVVAILRRRHPNLRLIHLDSVRLGSGEFIAEGISLQTGAVTPWRASLHGDLDSFGITESNATYAQFGEEGSASSFARIGTHLRVVREGGTTRAILRLPDNTLVDYLDGLPLRGSTAFSRAEAGSRA